MDADVLKTRTKQFALRVIRLTRALPRTDDGVAISRQLVRCGTSVGANYRATCKSRSRAEFVARIGVVEEEADESVYWLELIVEADILPAPRVQPLLDEANELTAIFAQSRKSAKHRPSSGTE